MPLHNKKGTAHRADGGFFMIYDHLSRLPLYCGLSPELDRAFAFLKELSPETLSPGRIEIDGEAVYANCFDGKTASPEGALYEAHNRYIDIHLPLTGCERVYYADRGTLESVIPYDADGDCEMRSGEARDFCTLDHCHFCVTFPADAHLPGRAADEPIPYRKLVLKVRIS